MIAHLLKTEQHAADGTSKRNADARGRARAQNLPCLCRVASVLVEQSTDDIARAHGIVHAGPLLADTESACNGQRQPNALDEERCRAQKPLHHKPGNDTLHLADA